MSWIARLLSTLLAVILNGALAAAIATAWAYAWIAEDLPEDLTEMRLQQPLRVYSSDGLLIGEFGAERREPLRFADTPPLLVKAFLAAEDSRFFGHPGVDVQSLARAALRLAQTGERGQGGSTITMQLARNFFLSREKTFRRKLAELVLALRIESRLSKEAIFELYQNKIFFGHRAYGVSAAARAYYGKGVQQLSLAQTAMLAGIPQAPSANNPVSRPRQAVARRDYVLGRMRDLGYIAEADYRQAIAEADNASLGTGVRTELEAPYVAEMVRRKMFETYGEEAYISGLRVITTIDARLQMGANQSLRNALRDYDRRHGYRGPERRRIEVPDPGRQEALDALLEDYPPVHDLRAAIVTQVKAGKALFYLGGGDTGELGLDAVKWARPYLGPNRRGPSPRKLADVLAVGDLIRVRKQPDKDWTLDQVPAVEGALVALGPADGAVKALVGGYDYERSQFNRAVDAQRQPGSSFKPLVYAAALARGWTPATLLRDEPLQIRDGTGRIWRPRNFDGKYLGPIRLREALTQSRNLASIDLMRNLGVEYTREFATRFGFDPGELPHGLSLVLGSGGVPPVKMAGAYARFANGGYRIDPYLISRVGAPDGRALYRAAPRVACVDCSYQGGTAPGGEARALPAADQAAEQVLDPGAVYQMRSLLGDVIRRGTGRRALSLARNDLAGKTGTSNDTRDSWFCGFQKSLVAVAWMGFDDFSTLGRGETGGRAALGMWIDFLRQALEGQPEALPEEPPGLLHVLVNRETGTLTDALDPEAIMETIREEYEIMLLGPRREMSGVDPSEPELVVEPPLPSDWRTDPSPRPQRGADAGNLLQSLF